MLKEELDTLVDVPLREVWENEQYDFTPWLAEHIDKLGNAIGKELEVRGIEEYVGPYKADILAENTDTGRLVIIENQLDPTDHIHLGQSIVYGAGKDAELIIWIAEKANPEHRKAVEWLNLHTDESVGFFLIEIELKRIGNSKPAPSFKIIESPNNWAKDQKSSTQSSGPNDALYEAFWDQFNTTAFSEKDEFTKLFREKSPAKYRYDLVYSKSRQQVIRFIIKTSKDQLSIRALTFGNWAWYNVLKAHEVEIDSIFDQKVEWTGTVDNTAGFIIKREDCPLKDENKWPEYIRWFKENAVKIEEVFKKWPAPDPEDEESTGREEE